jgi:hypothetical protein
MHSSLSKNLDTANQLQVSLSKNSSDGFIHRTNNDNYSRIFRNVNLFVKIFTANKAGEKSFRTADDLFFGFCPAGARQIRLCARCLFFACYTHDQGRPPPKINFLYQAKAQRTPYRLSILRFFRSSWRLGVLRGTGVVLFDGRAGFGRIKFFCRRDKKRKNDPVQ